MQTSQIKIEEPSLMLTKHELALILACSQTEPELDYIKDLVELCHVSPAMVNPNDNSSLLHSLAAQAPSMAICAAYEYLVSKGADVNAQKNGGETPSMLAAKRGDLSLLTLMKILDADFNIQNDQGETTFHYGILPEDIQG